MSPLVYLLFVTIFGSSISFKIGSQTCAKRYRTCLFSSLVRADVAIWSGRNLYGDKLVDYLKFYCKQAVPKYIMCAECGSTIPLQPSAMCMKTEPVNSFVGAVLSGYFTDVKCVRFWMNYHEHCLVPLYEPPENTSVLTAIVECYSIYRTDFDNCGENGFIAMIMRATHFAPMGSTLDVDLSKITQEGKNVE
ncbi:uncharacterized protein LOC106870274 [Octopus bimaculoides]|uniref:Uncharacterized protein n=1 Tax=Octopus bimaculoides TaxID=37653 RepID=A0A0L8IEY0_OCTBM|nr:uncharacterized protein LOC106870274 [Octopus bimaculoides]|eukprot:XP_014771781.1 PREDICTED: uncharacterized protein LOC106870274 [Octopus bimaculoides]